MNNENKSSKLKLISAGIFLLLGIILAIGYPTGGVKANKENRTQVVNKAVVLKTNTNTTQQAVVKKEKPKKKRVVPVTPPPSNNDEAEEEGC